MSRPFKHPKTSTYYFRKVVPDDLRRLVGKRELRISLKTKNPREAAARHPEVAAKVAAEWTALREGPKPLTLKEASALAGLWYRWFVPIFEDDPGTDPDGWLMWAEQLHDIDLQYRPELDERDFDPSTPRCAAAQRRVTAFLMDHGRVAEFLKANDIRLTDEQMPAFLEALEVEFFASMRLLARRAGRDFRPDRRPEQFPEWKPPAATKAAATDHGGSVTLTGVLDGWWREAQATGRKPSTHESYSTTMAALAAFLGHDDARIVTPDDVVRFKDHRLATINPRTGKRISAKTVKDSDLAGLKTLFGWAVSNRKLPSNPVTGITIKLGKQPKLRGKGFTDAEAKAILSAALHHQRGGESAGTFAAKRWVPWLAAYTGARVGELAQLRKQDVAREGDHWTIRLTPEAGTIKTNEARTVVLHPHLTELGFPAFVAAAPAGHLFLKVGVGGGRAGAITRPQEPAGGVRARDRDRPKRRTDARVAAPLQDRRHGGRHRDPHPRCDPRARPAHGG